MSKDIHQCADLMLAIEAEMRQVGLWETSPPSADALASLVPFCFDTLEFHQWLQWVFLPRMKQVVESDDGWPTTSDIFPMAEHAFTARKEDTAQLLALIKRVDHFINRRSL